VTLSSRQYYSPPTPLLPKYRPSYNSPHTSSSTLALMPVIEAPSPVLPLQPFEEDIFIYQSNAEKTLQEEGLANLVDDYTEKMREWLGTRLFPHVATFAELYLSRDNPNNQQWQAAMPYIQAYLDLGIYGFTLPHCVDYVARRIKELGSGTVLARYNWNRGTDSEASNFVWDPRYPCDAQIVMHLFCTFLDFRLVADPTTARTGKPFTSKYFLKSLAFLGKNSHTVIYQRYTNPPHFELVLPENKIWPIQQGHNNLFHTLACFVHTITKNNNGYLGPISISDPGILLSYVVE